MQVDQSREYASGGNDTFRGRNKDDYVQINDVQNLDNQEQYNLYGVVLDAGHPYKGHKSFLCSLKIIDPTCHPAETSSGGQLKVAIITCYANRFEDLPTVRKIGDLIRIHRATCKPFKDLKQFNVNLTFNASWCLFHSSDVNLRDATGSSQYDLSEDDSDAEDTIMVDG